MNGRTIDVEKALEVVQATMQAEYEVAVNRNEDLWSVKRSTDEKLLFLNQIGAIDNDEYKDMLAYSQKMYLKVKDYVNEAWINYP